MPRPRHKPAAPGRVYVVCAGRDGRGHEQRRAGPPLQAVDVGAAVLEFTWKDGSPVTGFVHEDGTQTFDFRCGMRREHWKPNQKLLSDVVKAAA